MAWPDWSGPSIPTDVEDFDLFDYDSWAIQTLLFTWATSLIYGAFYTWESYIALSRYAPNHPIWRNPSLRSVRAWAAADTAYPTISRGIGLMYSSYPALVLPTVAVAATAGWIATAEEHGAVPPATASGFGMPMGPTTGGSVDNPLGLTWDSLSQSLGNLVPGFLR